MDGIRKDIAQIRHPHRDTYFFTRVSGGISAYPAYRDGDDLIKAADDALYNAPNSG